MQGDGVQKKTLSGEPETCVVEANGRRWMMAAGALVITEETFFSVRVGRTNLGRFRVESEWNGFARLEGDKDTWLIVKGWGTPVLMVLDASAGISDDALGAKTI